MAQLVVIVCSCADWGRVKQSGYNQVCLSNSRMIWAKLVSIPDTAKLVVFPAAVIVPNLEVYKSGQHRCVMKVTNEPLVPYGT